MFNNTQLSGSTTPFLFQLTANFTSFNLKTALELRSNYSKRLYLLCAQWRDRPATPVYQLSYLRWMFALTADTPTAADKYQLFGHFNARILQPALTRLNAQSGVKVKVEPQKRARTVTGIKLLLRAAPPAPLPTPTASLAADTVLTSQQRVEKILDELGIVASHLRQRILACQEFIAQTFKFSYDLKAGKLRARTNAGGLLLKKLGLVN